ncbi:hypothetical protein PAXRUDRAFT_828602 [Paxillus rubicundulus Ve08.2h10]|uniref:Unplaced genomic scaffold scaffold_330, whole genome shotgun sequence n=1 Tax=Paxillus rubicundulus Ve08.2h10 TaxID=930991 RepID=A0A0D0DPD6_9AGAM|nr:hypothetical protein PAXRUDRAFT_828602 [Paxillus rubicundulus Ve08.2h10]
MDSLNFERACEVDPFEYSESPYIGPQLAKRWAGMLFSGAFLANVLMKFLPS